MKLVLATTNYNKIREYKELLKEFKNFEVLSLKDFPNYTPPEETGITFKENAEIKALSAAKALNAYVLADDSGLIVPALNGPGVKSARYAGEGASDEQNRLKLIDNLKSLTEEKRNGYFECCIALANPKKIIKNVSGFCEGDLILESKGNKGFGYDPLFIKYGYRKTFAELDSDVKNKISHRRKAFDKLLNFLHNLSHHQDALLY